MKCTKLFVGEYTSKTTGELKQSVFASFDNGQELAVAGKVEDVKERITAMKAMNIDPKTRVFTQEGEYGTYAILSAVKVEETLA